MIACWPFSRPRPERLPSAKRGHIADHAIGIYPDRTGAQPLRHSNGSAHIRCPHPGSQTEIDIITDLYRIFFILKRDDR